MLPNSSTRVSASRPSRSLRATYAPLPQDIFDDEPFPVRLDDANRAYLLGKQMARLSEASEPPTGYGADEARAYRLGFAEGVLGRRATDPQLDVEFDFIGFDSADEWPTSDEIDGYRYGVS